MSRLLQMHFINHGGSYPKWNTSDNFKEYLTALELNNEIKVTIGTILSA